MAKNGTGYIVGKSLTVADLLGLNMWNYLAFLSGSAETINAFPSLAAHKKLISAHPKIAEYYGH